jgi:hypothetical protein
LTLTADELERRHPRRNLHLDVDGAGLDALERDCRGSGSPC